MSLHTCECMVTAGAWALCAASVARMRKLVPDSDKPGYRVCGEPAYQKRNTIGYGWIWVCDTCMSYMKGEIPHHPCLEWTRE